MRLSGLVMAFAFIVVYLIGASIGYENGKKEQAMKDMIQHTKDWPGEVKAIKEMICP